MFVSMGLTLRVKALRLHRGPGDCSRPSTRYWDWMATLAGDLLKIVRFWCSDDEA
ncbi:hypothetical protein CIT292_10942 [Citrobacter youngae ATCC 29220]|uniref:Cellulase n=1 Tax=Citrobacter youngae ATCC 29220 TaxID=500640 RepID=D4BJU8_9ENTR|nr:hypothetical protein CIT292_10942 [Citrobacter youngae ATCC 29220]